MGRAYNVLRPMLRSSFRCQNQRMPITGFWPCATPSVPTWGLLYYCGKVMLTGKWSYWRRVPISCHLWMENALDWPRSRGTCGRAPFHSLTMTFRSICSIFVPAKLLTRRPTTAADRPLVQGAGVANQTPLSSDNERRNSWPHEVPQSIDTTPIPPCHANFAQQAMSREPGHANLLGQAQGGQVVLVADHHMDRQKPLLQGQIGDVKQCAGHHRGLVTVVSALANLAGYHPTIVVVPTFWTLKVAIGPILCFSASAQASSAPNRFCHSTRFIASTLMISPPILMNNRRLEP